MKQKKKICFGCSKEQFIFKRFEGKPYCLNCSRFLEPPKHINQTKPIAKRSKKKIQEDEEYSLLRKEFLELNPYCKINTIHCTHSATEVHHTEYRGKNYLNTKTWLPACNTCHKWCHANPKQAAELGFLKAIR